MIEEPVRVAMSVAGSDSGGGAGIQADLMTMAACRVYATTAITCLTAQNPDGVSAVHPMSADFVREQMEQVAAFFTLRAIKVGMVFNAEIATTVGDFLAANPHIPAVVDPVMVATSGARLLKEDAIRAVTTQLLPQARIVTPNLDELGILIGERPGTVEQMEASGTALADKLGTAVLAKGGHLEGDWLTDVLCEPGKSPRRLQSPRVKNLDTHGSGCTLSSAITAGLAQGHDLADAVARAQEWFQHAAANAVTVGNRRYLNHVF